MRAPEGSVSIKVTISGGNTIPPETGRQWRVQNATNCPRQCPVVVVVVRIFALSMARIYAVTG
jgi:L-lactate utilization protein LutB